MFSVSFSFFFLNIVVSWYLQGIDSRTPLGYQNSLMLLKFLMSNGIESVYSEPSAFIHFQPWSKNSVFSLQLVESVNVKPMDIEV